MFAEKFPEDDGLFFVVVGAGIWWSFWEEEKDRYKYEMILMGIFSGDLHTTEKTPKITPR